MSLIFEQATDGPATHAIVIGVGDYPHLDGGADNMSNNSYGMGQLYSPPHSARKFAEWLLTKYDNPKKIGTVDLIISDSITQHFYNPRDNQTVQIERATFEAVKNAISAWYKRGNSHEENFMILYFCGHGMGSGSITSLVLEDFGSNDANELHALWDFSDFHQGMERCRARQQCFFIDACRVASSTLIGSLRSKGDPIIPGSAYFPHSGSRQAPVYYSTFPGSYAYGRLNDISLFSEALLRALDGSGSDDTTGNWIVYPNTLLRGINYLLSQLTTNGGDQSCFADSLADDFIIHQISSTPMVSVTISCEPEEHNAEASLAYSDDQNNEILRTEKSPAQWETFLEAGIYNFIARIEADEFRGPRSMVRPPYRLVKIKVTK